MKRLFASLVVILIFLSMVSSVWAVNATEANNPQAEPAIMYGEGINGIYKISAGPNNSKCTQTDVIVSSTPIKAYMVNLYSDVAGDDVTLYNWTSAEAAYLECKVAIGVNTSSNSINLQGTQFTELFLDVTGTNPVVTVTYIND